MKYKDFEVRPEFIKDGHIRWVVTGNGLYILGEKGGRCWFIKRDMHLRRPVREMPKAVYEAQKPVADHREKKQRALRGLMKGLDRERDGIVAETENFWDDENMFVTVTPYIEGPFAAADALCGLGRTQFVALALATAAALDKLHACGVIHGDLKEKNIIVTRAGGVLKPYLIDFDSAYPADAVPEWHSIGGTDGYRSPEALYYAAKEGKVPPDEITAATDIFSLGVVYHRWWTGAFPGIDLERGELGTAVFLGKAHTVDKKFDVALGDKCGATLYSLLEWMFAKDPAARPTAGQVVQVLSDELEVPEAYRKGSDVKAIVPELWEAHAAVAELLGEDELRAKGVRAFRRVNEGSGSDGLVYRVTAAKGAEKKYTVSELCEAGLARRKSAAFCVPWEEHDIELEPSDVFFAKGYAGIARAEVNYRKLYLLTTLGGRTIDKGLGWLVGTGLAHYKRRDVAADTPWPEDGAAYEREELARSGVKSVARVEVGGLHRYKIVFAERGGDKTVDGVPGKNMKLMGFIKE